MDHAAFRGAGPGHGLQRLLKGRRRGLSGIEFDMRAPPRHAENGEADPDPLPVQAQLSLAADRHVQQAGQHGSAFRYVHDHAGVTIGAKSDRGTLVHLITKFAPPVGFGTRCADDLDQSTAQVLNVGSHLTHPILT